MVSPTRRKIYVVTSIFVVGIALGVGWLFVVSDAGRTAEFDGFTALAQSESWQKGWVPSFIPRNATRIRVGHDIDTNHVYGEFTAQSFLPLRDAPGSRALMGDERTRLLASVTGNVRSQIGKAPILSWCDKADGLGVYLHVKEDGRVMYWGGGDGCAKS